MDLFLHSPQLFIYRADSSIPPSPSPAQHFNPARTNREIKKLKMRHDERGSQRTAGCRQVKRQEVLGRRAGWRFFIRHSHFFTSWNMMLFSMEERWDEWGKKKTTECNTCCLSFLFSHLWVPIFPVFLKGNIHEGSHLIYVLSLQVIRSQQFTLQAKIQKDYSTKILSVKSDKQYVLDIIRSIKTWTI